MRVVVLKAFGDVSNLSAEERAVPEPQEGEVRIQVKVAGFNPVDTKIRKGYLGRGLPQVLGADCSGLIDAVGSGVTEFSIGDRVMAMSYGQASNGSYAEYLTLPTPFVAPIPAELSFEEAAAIPLASMTAYRALIASRALEAHDHLLILGAGGGVGSMGVYLARWALAGKIITIARNEESAHWLQKHLSFAPEEIVLYGGLSTDALIEKIVALQGGNLFETTFDCVGGKVKEVALRLTGYSGHFSTCLPENDFTLSAWQGLVFERNMSLHIVSVGAEAMLMKSKHWEIYREHLHHISALLASGALPPPNVTTVGDFSLETICQAHHRLEEGRVKGKLVMSFN